MPRSLHPQIDRAAAEELAQRIDTYAIGDRAEIGASWLHNQDRMPGEITAPQDVRAAHLMYRNRMQPWAGFFVTGYQDGGEVLVRARDIGFDASRVFLFFNAVMESTGSHRFMPEVKTYTGHVLYTVRYIR